MDGGDSSRSDSSADDPLTPPPHSHVMSSKTARSFTAPSKLARYETPSASRPHSISQPRFSGDATAAPAPATPDWGGNEWSRIVQEIKMQKEKTESTTELHEKRPQQHEELSAVSLKDASSDKAHGAADTWWSEETALDNKAGDTGIEVGSNHCVSEDELESHIRKINSFDSRDSGESDTNQSVLHHPSSPPPTLDALPLAIEEEEPHPLLNAIEPCPQTILRGLIRDAHREMMYFTLPHSSFSLDDLHDGLDYAFGMLQTATTKLAMLAVLLDDMANVQAVDLRRWIFSIDCLDPLTCYEPRMPVVFECLSTGEARLALAELVQSRVIVEDEVKRMKQMLERKAEALEREMEIKVRDHEHAALDAWVTAIMVVVFVALYLAVR